MAISSVMTITTLSNNRAIFEGQNCPTRGILLRFYSSLRRTGPVLLCPSNDEEFRIAPCVTRGT